MKISWCKSYFGIFWPHLRVIQKVFFCSLPPIQSPCDVCKGDGKLLDQPTFLYKEFAIDWHIFALLVQCSLQSSVLNRKQSKMRSLPHLLSI